MRVRTGNNKKVDRVRQSTGTHFRIFPVPFRTGERNVKRLKAEDGTEAVANCTVTRGRLSAVPRNSGAGHGAGVVETGRGMDSLGSCL